MTVKSNVSTIPKLVKEVRKTLGWTQKKLADALGTTVVSVAAYERGRHGIGPLFLLRLIGLAPPEFREELSAHLPADFHGLRAAASLNIARQKTIDAAAIRDGSIMQAKPSQRGRESRKGSRYSDKTRQALHSALDLALEHAPSIVVEQLEEILTKFATRFTRSR